jgi:pimeloyl-ACP methyl ester carboxylesterase
VRCFATAEEQNAFFGALPAFPVGSEIPAWLAAYRDYSSRCARVAGPIIDHSSTANFVRDLDLLRQAVGDPGFSFLGYSYGSQVGSTYAAMFPSRVRAVVIDGVVDPVAWSTGYGGTGALLPITTRLKSAEGASDTLGAFFRTCAAAGPARCSFADRSRTAPCT